MVALDWNRSDLSTMNREVEEKAGALLRQAELFLEVQGYHRKEVQSDGETIDITASTPDADETVVMRIVAKSKLKSNGVGVEQVADAKQILEAPEVDRVIVFGKSFTQAARNNLQDDGIAFFSTDQRFMSTLNPSELYTSILTCVDELCQSRCGHVPQAEAECTGYSGNPMPCPICGGEGRTNGSRCPRCGGTGLQATQYTCDIRLLSDNADFHAAHGWNRLLQHDLLALLAILRASNHEANTRPLTSLPPKSPDKTPVPPTEVGQS
jgi:hypothetical protein